MHSCFHIKLMFNKNVLKFIHPQDKSLIFSPLFYTLKYFHPLKTCFFSISHRKGILENSFIFFEAHFNTPGFHFAFKISSSFLFSFEIMRTRKTSECLLHAFHHNLKIFHLNVQTKQADVDGWKFIFQIRMFCKEKTKESNNLRLLSRSLFVSVREGKNPLKRYDARYVEKTFIRRLELCFEDRRIIVSWIKYHHHHRA